MANVYVEPRPKGRPENAPIDDYILEFAHGERMDRVDYKTQAAAIAAAKAVGHQPLVARVRNTDKGKPDQWRPA